MTKPVATTIDASGSDLLHLRRSFVRHLAADRRTPATRRAYSAAIVQLEAFLLERRLPTAVTELTPDHLEAFIVSLYERGMRPTTILARRPVPLLRLAGRRERVGHLADGVHPSAGGEAARAAGLDGRGDRRAARGL